MVVNQHSSVSHIDKLRGPENYTTWKVEMKSCLNRDGVWKVVCGREVKQSSATSASVAALAATSPSPPPTTPTRKVTVIEDETFDERNEIAFDTIVLGLIPSLQQHIAHCGDDGKTAWEIFERLYDASHAQKPTRLALRRQLYKSSPMDPGESIREFINRKIAISEKLLDLGTLVDESELADCILMDVADEFRGIVGVLERRGGYGFNDVKGALTQEELEKRMKPICTEEQLAVKREPNATITPHPPAPPPTVKRPLLGMGADHPPTAIRPAPVAIARQSSTRNAKRPHQEDRDEDVPAAVGSSQTSPTTAEAKKKYGEDKDDFKKPRMGIRNGGRKPKIQTRREPQTLPLSLSPTNPVVATPSSAVAATSSVPAPPQDRPFTCLFTFASCTQTFSSKNEWKRHINHIHLQLWYWRCDFPSCANRKAFFNRKDLFGQHLKRMHAPSNSNEIQERCKKERRKPPEKSKCGFCGRLFEGTGGWEACVDHVGEHYTSGSRGKDWKVDEGFVEWALNEGVVQKGEGGVLVQDPRVFPLD